jgi:hypothetical protein
MSGLLLQKNSAVIAKALVPKRARWWWGDCFDSVTQRAWGL